MNALASKKSGFTLLELVVVLAIMGFLIAMLAPKFAKLVESSVGTVDDTSQRRVSKTMSAFVEDSFHLPNDLTNLVKRTGALGGSSSYEVPNFDNNEINDGAEALSYFFNSNLKPALHYLNLEEVAELRDLGITHLFNLNINHTANPEWDTDGGEDDPEGAFMERVVVEEGLGVLMVGAGASLVSGSWEFSGGDTSGDLFASGSGAPSEWDWIDPDYNDNRTHVDPTLFYRIILGVGRDSELTSNDMIKNAPVAPTTRRGKHFVYKDYCVILPRLKATTRRLLPNDSIGRGLNEGGGDMWRYMLIQGTTTGSVVTNVDLSQTQLVSQFATSSPQGDIWPRKNNGDALYRILLVDNWEDELDLNNEVEWDGADPDFQSTMPQIDDDPPTWSPQDN